MTQQLNLDKLEFVFSVGEASGDRVASALFLELKASAPNGLNIHGSGICGQNMSDAGIASIVDCRNWGSIGVIEALRLYPQYKMGMRKIQYHLLKLKPQDVVLVLVDFGYFNIQLAKWARRKGFEKIIYFMPPGSWKRVVKIDKLSKFVQLCSLIITPFSWSDINLREAGGNSRWVGHPLLDIVKTETTRTDFCKYLRISETEKVIALLPGSRSGEINNILPELLKAAKLIKTELSEVNFVIPASSKINEKQINAVIKKAEVPFDIKLVVNRTYDCLGNCDFALITSGTATLEAAILGIPMVIVYGGSWLIEQEYKLRRKKLNINYFGLPNIIAVQKIVPEVIFLDGKGSEKAAELAIQFLKNKNMAENMKQSLKSDVVPKLGEPGVMKRAASEIWSYLSAN